MRVFVYGTLLKGEGNHSLLDDEVFISKARIKGELKAVSHSFPGAFFSEYGMIKGELYEIKAETLRNLDRLEGYSQGNSWNMYTREEVEVFREDGEDSLGLCFAYFWVDRGEEHPLIPSGYWKDF